MISTDAVELDEIEREILALEPEDDANFSRLASVVAKHQHRQNPVVRAFGRAGRYLPIGVFRESRVAAFPPSEQVGRFVSSGTGSDRRAIHPIRSFGFYERVVSQGFDRVFGQYASVIVGYLPGYATDSSLVHMVRHLAVRSNHAASGIFHDDRNRLEGAIRAARDEHRRFILIGAAFGLLDLVDTGAMLLPPDAIVVETGGMKTRRRETSREVLHARLSEGFEVERARIWSEHGMCELMSQAWMTGGRGYAPPPWMRVEVVDPEQPDLPVPDGTAGQLAVTDLANLHSASFLLTEDRAVRREGHFEVLGRMSQAMLRGCNFLLES